MSDAPVVVAMDDQDDHAIDLDRWSALARRVLHDEAIPGPAELNLTFIGRDEMTELNVEHMGGTGPTDVLSFPIDPFPEPGLPPDQPRLLGDIMICPTIVHGQAPGDPDEEMALMVVHGVLHLRGFEHDRAVSAERMEQREREILAEFGYADPYA